MKRSLSSHGVLVAMAVFTTMPAIAPPHHHALQGVRHTDPRLAKLQRFLKDNECPVRNFADDFLREADTHHLDWRLLPSISIIESGCGRALHNNNIFGWDSGKAVFPSVETGIHAVANQLETSIFYKDKDVDGILRAYNPNQDYPARVKSVMARLSSPDDSVD